MRENIRAVAAWRIQGNQQENERSPRIHSHNRQHHCSHPIPPSRPSRVQVGGERCQDHESQPTKTYTLPGPISPDQQNRLET